MLPPDSYSLPLDPTSLAMGLVGALVVAAALTGMAWIGRYRSINLPPRE